MNKKIISAVLTVALILSALSLTVIGASAASGGITSSGGWLESAYAEWRAVEGADGYNVYVTKNGSSDWRRIDDMLIRRYADYWRADVVGLNAGKYKMKIVPTAGGKELDDRALVTAPLTVSSHDRSGYAFDTGSTFKTASGAYNDNGTLKKDAQVVYVTKDTAKTCTATVNGKTYEGFQSILDAKQKQGTSEPICFRIIGLVTLDDLDHISSDSEGLQIKGKKSYTAMNITIEGIGFDATVSGFGFLIRNAGNVEIRNIGIINFMDDGISVDTDNTNLWVHNCDFFYGGEGSDSDQVKGDGSLDTKKSQYITYSYNHFYDSGKVHLVGNGSSDSVNYLTFHHNWYDHADSRMPRVRSATAHVYNNFYDGISKYGIGATLGSDIFSEANYFLNTKCPMLISKQGSDIIESSKGTFSGENGGMIKSFADVIVNASNFVSYQQNNTQFDAYVASSRDEKLPSNVKAVAGGATYNNFDTASDFYTYTVETAEEAMSTVKQYAGRINGGDLKWTFTSADNSDYEVNQGLKNAVVNYKSSLLSVSGVKDGFVSDGDYENGFDDIVEVPHVHEYTESFTKAPTCTEDGLTTYTCECSDSYTETVAAKGHTFAEGACVDCGAADPDFIPDVDDPTDPDNGENGGDTPEDPKPEDPKPEDPKPEDPKPEDPKPEDPDEEPDEPCGGVDTRNIFEIIWDAIVDFFKKIFGLQ